MTKMKTITIVVPAEIPTEDLIYRINQMMSLRFGLELGEVIEED